MEVGEARRTFHTFDALRGVAALIIVTRHAQPFTSSIYFPQSFLAVDIFFGLSGFVIAHAYDARIARGRFLGEFLKIRLIRLYPLYLLGILIGIVHRINSIAVGVPGWTAHRLLEAIGYGLLLKGGPLDGPTWTLLPEIVANMIYAALFRWMKAPVLICIVLLGGGGLIYWSQTHTTLDGGWLWSQTPLIVCRLAFSFFGGVLLFRLWGDRRKSRNLIAYLCVAALTATLILKPPAHFAATYDVIVILLIFPPIVWAASISEPNAISGRVFRFLGLISYAVYTLHQPIASIMNDVLMRMTHNHPVILHKPFAAAFLLGIIALAWLVDERFDAPVRRRLQRMLLKRGPAKTASAISAA